MSKLTVQDIMKRCDVHLTTVHGWIDKGYLKATKAVNTPGSRWEIEEEDLEAFLLSENYAGHPEDIRKNRCFNRKGMLEDCYPINLLRSVLSINLENLDRDEEPHDIWDYDIRHFLNLVQLLRDREIRVIELRYRFGFSLDETAAAFGVTRERIRQIQVKAERKLRYWCHKNGVFVIKHEQYEALMNENRSLKATIASLEDQVVALKSHLGELADSKGNVIDESAMSKNVDRVTIEELDLNVRCYNCLKRAGFNTLGDIIYFDQHQGDNSGSVFKSWWHIRNLGRKSIAEVAKVIFNYCGYRIQDWDEKNGYLGLIPVAENDVFCRKIYRGE